MLTVKGRTMDLRRKARTTNLFEFVRNNIRDRWNHVDGNGYRELAQLWWRIRRKTVRR
jgi:hypothetical protein